MNTHETTKYVSIRSCKAVVSSRRYFPPIFPLTYFHDFARRQIRTISHKKYLSLVPTLIHTQIYVCTHIVRECGENETFNEFTFQEV